MQFVAIFLPGFLACRFQEKLEKAVYHGSELIKVWGMYTFFINLFAIMIYQYILKTPNSINENFGDNIFLIHYMLLNVILAVVLPFFRAAVNPFLSLKLEWKSAKGANEHEDGPDAEE